MGDLLNERTKAREGVLMSASIPQPDGKDKIFLYSFRQIDPSMRWAPTIVLAPAENIQDRAFQLSIAAAGIGGRPKKIQAALEDTNKFLSGSFFEGAGGVVQTDWTATFKLVYIGNGKNIAIEAIKKTKKIGLGLNPPNIADVIIDDVKRVVDFTQWPD